MYLNFFTLQHRFLLLAPVQSSFFRRATPKLNKIYFKDTKENDQMIFSQITCFCHTES